MEDILTNETGNIANSILRPTEAAKYLGLSPSTLAKRRLRGEPPRYFKIGSRAVGYSIDELDNFLASCMRNSTSDPGSSV